MEPLADDPLRYQPHTDDQTALFRKGYLEQLRCFYKLTGLSLTRGPRMHSSR